MLQANRAEVIDQNFRRWIIEGNLPDPTTATDLRAAGLNAAKFMDLFESQMISRHLDLAARRFRVRNLTFYTIGSSGHEGNAVLGEVFRLSDMAFLHYRSGALFAQRAKKSPGFTPLYEGLLSLAASKDDPISQGRHKVFGSKVLNVPPQTSTIASHLPKALGAALSIRRARDLGHASELPYDAMILCNFGDASSNHASAQSAFNTAALCSYQRIPVPLVLVCEDNSIGISVPTPMAWIESNFYNRPGLKYFKCDGLNLCDAYRVACEVERFVRHTRQPAFMHMKTVRLMGHAGSDVELSYRSLPEIEATERNDPLLHSARIALQEGILPAPELLAIYDGLRQRVDRVGEIAVMRPKLTTIEEVKASVVPPAHLRSPKAAIDPQRRSAFWGEKSRLMAQKQHMARQISWALADLMLQYPETLVFGEDVAKKGGVYNVTSGLLDFFGPKRVFNSPLDETNILGTAIGMAHNGFIPIPEIQFLAYFHNAEDQLRGEAATLSFFSSGQFQNPMVIRIAGLAYQKGFGGHFHNDNSLSIFRDIPGLIVAVPSRGDDAARMLRHCVRQAYEHGRICVFVEPIALYMTRDLHQEQDGGWAFDYPDPSTELSLGEVGVYGEQHRDLVILTYGNGCYLSLQAQRILEEQLGIMARVVDLRWICPLNADAIITAISGCDQVLIVDECRKTGSLSEQLVSLLVESHLPQNPSLRMRVHAAEDCFIPLGTTATLGLPSRESIVHSAVAFLQGRHQHQKD